MTHQKLIKSTLVVAGIVAVGIGGAIVAAPQFFYASYGIQLSADANLMNEIRAPGGALVGSGALMLLGGFVSRFRLVGLLLAACIYIGYGGSRLVSMAVDGLPDGGLIAALGIELAIGLLCLTFLLRQSPAIGRGG